MDQTCRRIAAPLALFLLADVAAAVDFAPSIEAARQSGDASRPVVLTFSAPWCGWCRKMAASTFVDPQVEAVAEQYLWVKVDPEESPSLAARMRVHGLPHTVLLDAHDRVLGSQPGYMTTAAFLAFLQESIANPQPIEGLPATLLAQLAALEQADHPEKAVREAVELLLADDPIVREDVLAALKQSGPALYPHLVHLLTDDRLATRAAAGGVLQKLTRADVAFDPFADPEQRSQQADGWRRWVAEHAS